MGGWIGLITTLASVVLFFKLGHHWLGGLGIGIALVQFWSFGVMHNFAYAPIVRWGRAVRQLREDGFPDEDVQLLEGMKPEPDPQLAPDWVTAINVLVTLVGLGLLITAIILWRR